MTKQLYTADIRNRSAAGHEQTKANKSEKKTRAEVDGSTRDDYIGLHCYKGVNNVTRALVTEGLSGGVYYQSKFLLSRLPGSDFVENQHKNL